MVLKINNTYEMKTNKNELLQDDILMKKQMSEQKNS